MRLHEIKNIPDENLYETHMTGSVLLDEGAKELFDAGMKKMGQAADKLKDAVDAPAQKAWADVQSRLATAGKDDAIGKLKDFASKHKVAIGTMAIIGMGLLTATGAEAANVDIMQDVMSAVQDAHGVQLDVSDLQNIQVKGMPAEEYANLASKSINNAIGSSRIDMRAAAIDNITQAIQDAVGQGKDAAAGTEVASSGSMGDGIAGNTTAGQDDAGQFDTTNKQWTRQNMDADTARRLRTGK